MRTSERRRPASAVSWLLIGLFAWLVLAASAGAQAGDDERVHVKIRKIVKDCEENEDCEKQHHRILISRDGDHTVAIDGDDLQWVGEHDGHFAFVSGEAHGGFLGVQLTPLTDELRLHFGAPEGVGVMVGEVKDDSPAWRAGLEVADVILRYNDQEIRSPRDLVRAVRHSAGEEATLEVLRQGQLHTMVAQIEERSMREASGHRALFYGCDDGDCEHDLSSLGLDCDGDECEIEVDCDDGDCACTVNGETVECDQFHTLHFGDDR